jgi:3D (Asp-Asp-Asp) domain-containing protein
MHPPAAWATVRQIWTQNGGWATEAADVFLLRRATRWTACAILAVAFVAAEDWVGERRSAPSAAAPICEGSAHHEDVVDFGVVAAPGQGFEAPPALIIDDPNAYGERAKSALKTEVSHRDGVRRQRGTRKIERICRVTAYADRGVTASGVHVGVGQCAAPGDIPFGAEVYIPELGRTFVVTDRTHRRFRHNTVDVFIPSKKLCREFGRRYHECEFTLPE